jgi:hypothetical protein
MRFEILGAVAATLAVGFLAHPQPGAAQSAQLEVQPGQFALKLSGFENLEGAETTGSSGGARSESEIEIGPQYRTPSGVVIAGRAVLNLQAQTYLGGAGSAWSLTQPELSLFAIGPFGRVEIGQRAGFPQSSVGYTPSEIAFTAAEFGPDSGLRLDPNGRLPTAFLPPALADRINGLTYLGYAARFYDDRSAKIIYLSPRSRGGFYGAISYTPRVDQNGGGFILADGARAPTRQLSDTLPASGYRNLVQAALVWNHRTEVLDLSLGGTFSHAQVAGVPPVQSILSQTSAASERRSDSLSFGATATLHDTWTLGLSGTYDGLSERPALPGGGRGAIPYGVVTSLNWVSGPWAAGGYYQHAVGASLVGAGDPIGPIAAGRATDSSRDQVDIGELGASYLVDKNHDLLGAGYYTDVRLFTSVYVYQLRSQDLSRAETRQSDAVFIVGARFAFF